jgi:hypothetical protein
MGVPIVTIVGLVAAAAFLAARYVWFERRGTHEARRLADLEMMETVALSNAILASLPIAVLDRAGALISAHDQPCTMVMQTA